VGFPQGFYRLFMLFLEELVQASHETANLAILEGIFT